MTVLPRGLHLGRQASTFLATSIFAMATQLLAASSDWPQWRGPHRMGVSDEPGAVTDSPGRNIAWRTAIERREHSSPIVSRGRIVLTTSIKGTHVPGRKAPVHLGCDRQPGYVHPDSVYASPAIADGRIYIRGERHLFAIAAAPTKANADFADFTDLQEPTQSSQISPIVESSGPFASMSTTGSRGSAVSLPPEEVRAVAYLTREVPRWKAENDCYSCHNNGDAARALIVAKTRGHAVGDALNDTLEWLRQPQKWNHNEPGAPPGGVGVAAWKTQGGSDDKPLARVQFAGALRLAVSAGLAPAAAIGEAAALVAADQKANGSWQLDTSQSIGSPTTYGTTLATWAAKRALVAAGRDRFAAQLAPADRWLRAASVASVIDAAAVVLALGDDRDTGAVEQRRRALATLQRGQARDGGWGPYTTVGPEVFDTALVLLALRELQRQQTPPAPFAAEELSRAIARGRTYLTRLQLSDGSWPETTRPSNQESYAQRISTTGWALLALLETR